MIIQITKSTTFVQNILNQSKNGIIHSVYRKTINILFNSQLIAIQCAGSPVSPLSMISSLSSKKFNSLDIEIGDKVSVIDQQISIYRNNNTKFIFDFSDSNIISTYLNLHLSDELLKEIRISVQKVLCSGKCDGIARIGAPFVDIDIPLYLPVAEKDLKDSLISFKNQDWEKSAFYLGKMIGLGIGLTPCGDDFLCGVMAALILSDKESHPFTIELKKYISAHLTDTNDISSAFLNCALQQHFSQPIHLLSSGIPSDEIEYLFQQIGHSSGMDTLCGICYILKLSF